MFITILLSNYFTRWIVYSRLSNNPVYFTSTKILHYRSLDSKEWVSYSMIGGCHGILPLPPLSSGSDHWDPVKSLSSVALAENCDVKWWWKSAMPKNYCSCLLVCTKGQDSMTFILLTWVELACNPYTNILWSSIVLSLALEAGHQSLVLDMNQTEQLNLGTLVHFLWCTDKHHFCFTHPFIELYVIP